MIMLSRWERIKLGIVGWSLAQAGFKTTPPFPTLRSDPFLPHTHTGDATTALPWNRWARRI
jgi:hypothetical protein